MFRERWAVVGPHEQNTAYTMLVLESWGRRYKRGSLYILEMTSHYPKRYSYVDTIDRTNRTVGFDGCDDPNNEPRKMSLILDVWGGSPHISDSI